MGFAESNFLNFGLLYILEAGEIGDISAYVDPLAFVTV